MKIFANGREINVPANKRGEVDVVEVRRAANIPNDRLLVQQKPTGETQESICQREGVTNVANKQIMDKISIYVPQKKMAERPVERLIKLAEKKDRSVNYLVVEAILEYLKRERE